jgi:hypothetical protein
VTATPAEVTVKVLAVIVVGSIASLNVALTFAMRATPVAPSSGVVDVTAGAWVVEPPVPVPPPVPPPVPLEVLLELEVPLELAVLLELVDVEEWLDVPVPPVPPGLSDELHPAARVATRRHGTSFN